MSTYLSARFTESDFFRIDGYIMIVECPHCNGLLQTDETVFFQGQTLHARCPKCSGEGFYIGTIRETVAKAGPSSDGIDRETGFRKTGVSQASDFTIPDDAFKNFRFPAETEALRARRAGVKPNFRALVIAGLSIFVIALFAALVNIILPGPRPYAIEHTGLPVDVNFNETSGVSQR